VRSIYVIDNEESVRFIVSKYLVREGFQVEGFCSLEEMILRLQSGFPDLLIMDIMMSGRDEFDFCRDIKSRNVLPVIFTFDRGAEIDSINALKSGENEYLIKPFSPRELVSRVRSIFRRCAQSIMLEQEIMIGNLTINTDDRRTMVNDDDVMLTPMEYELLLLFAQQPQRTFSRQELLDRVWGYDYVGRERAVDDLVKRLRKKLKDKGSTKNVITIWGYGYRFEE